MKLETKEIDPGGNLYAAKWRVELNWDKRMLQLVRPETGNEVHLYWYSYPDARIVKTWDQDTSIQEIMNFIANLPEKRESAAFTLP